MAVPRAKKKKKTKQELMIGIQELSKSIMYLYLRDVKKFDYDEILKMNKFFARQVANIGEGLITFDNILDDLLAKGIDMNRLGRETDHYLNQFWEV